MLWSYNHTVKLKLNKVFYPNYSSRYTAGRLKMQDWKMSDESARLKFDGLAMRVKVQKTVKSHNEVAWRYLVNEIDLCRSPKSPKNP